MFASVVPLRPNSRFQTQVASLEQRGCLTLHKNFTADSLSASPRATATAGAPGSPILNFQEARNLSNKHTHTLPYIQNVSKCINRSEFESFIHPKDCQSKVRARYESSRRLRKASCAFRLSSTFLSFCWTRLCELTVHAKVCAAACLRPYGKFQPPSLLL